MENCNNSNKINREKHIVKNKSLSKDQVVWHYYFV